MVEIVKVVEPKLIDAIVVPRADFTFLIKMAPAPSSKPRGYALYRS
jgi:hypothetical protein